MSDWWRLLYRANDADQYSGLHNNLIHYMVVYEGDVLYYSTRHKNNLLEGEQFAEAEW